MLTGVELMKSIEHIGQWNVQELVAKSQDTRDVLTYLRAERSLELVKAMPFVWRKVQRPYKPLKEPIFS